MLTLPARLNQFTPIDGEKFSIDEALARFAPILQEVYAIVGNPVTDREKLFFLRGVMRGYKFHSICTQEETPERTDAVERECVEYAVLCNLGLIL